MKAFKYANISIPNRAGHRVRLVHFLERFYKVFGCCAVFSSLYGCILKPSYQVIHSTKHCQLCKCLVCVDVETEYGWVYKSIITNWGDWGYSSTCLFLINLFFIVQWVNHGILVPTPGVELRLSSSDSEGSWWLYLHRISGIILFKMPEDFSDQTYWF